AAAIDRAGTHGGARPGAARRPAFRRELAPRQHRDRDGPARSLEAGHRSACRARAARGQDVCQSGRGKKGRAMKPLSEHLLALIAVAEDVRRWPSTRPVEFLEFPRGFAEVAAFVRRAHQAPSEGIRATYAGVAM